MINPYIEVIADNVGGLTIQNSETKKVSFFASRSSKDALDSLRSIVFDGDDMEGWEFSDPGYYISDEIYQKNAESRGYCIWGEIDILRHLIRESDSIQKSVEQMKVTRSSRKALVFVNMFDPRDMCSTGYTFTLYEDGHVSAEYRSRWQGSRNGARFVTGPGFVDLRDLDSDDIDNDAEARLTEAIRHARPDEDSEWRQTRRGHVVR